MPRRRSLLSLVVVAVLATACQVRLAADVAVGRDGSGTFAFAVAIDEELAQDLREAGVEPLAGLEDAGEESSRWEVVGEEPEDGGVRVRLQAPFDDPDGLAELAADLHRALDRDDLRVHDGLRLERRDDGSVAFSGRVGLDLPAAPGAEGQGVDFDAEDLQRLLQERGEEFVRYDVRVTLPGDPVEHDADEVDGDSLVWRAPVDGMREISAVSAPPGIPPVLLAVAVGALAAVVTGVGAYLWRRRRREEPLSPAG